ncbi:MAG: NAD(P)H-binding protein [Actinomycetota bacterium]|nr:NAD(P)H-binding protein [Actinomycetota bacterium]
MPVIVIGADTDPGREVVATLAGRAGEVRAFVTDRQAAPDLRRLGAKVAIGDISDGSHVGAAAIGCYTAVVIASAAEDERERSFATSTAEVHAAWAEALEDARISRVIWVGAEEPPQAIAAATTDLTTVDPTRDTFAVEVRMLDDAG